MMPNGRGIKQKVLDLRLAKPQLKYEEIAGIVGTSRRYVQLVCCLGGIGTGPQPKPSKYLGAFLRVQQEHPDWGSHRIARAIGCAPSLAYHLQKKYGRASRADIARLGAEAMAAGITLQIVQAVANARHA